MFYIVIIYAHCQEIMDFFLLKSIYKYTSHTNLFLIYKMANML